MGTGKKPKSSWDESTSLGQHGMGQPDLVGERDTTFLSFLPIKMLAEDMYTGSCCLSQFKTSIILISLPRNSNSSMLKILQILMIICTQSWQ